MSALPRTRVTTPRRWAELHHGRPPARSPAPLPRLVFAALLALAPLAPLHGQSEPLPAELEPLLARLLELRSEEEGILAGLTDEERRQLLAALAERLAEPTSTVSPEVGPSDVAVAPSSTPTPDAVPAGEAADVAAATPTPAVVPDAPRADTAVALPSRCNTLHFFDTNRDLRFSGADRHFRNFRLWLDENGNGTAESSELEPLLAAGVRSLTLDLRSYTTSKKELTGDVFVGDTIEVELLGRRGRTELRLLGVDADAIAADGFTLEDANGAPLRGVVIFRPGMVLVRADEVDETQRLVLDCPRSPGS